MHALMTAIVLWLSANFDLPANYEHPRIERVTAQEMQRLRYRGLAGESTTVTVGLPAQEGRSLVALYDMETHTIYLPEGWRGKTPAELSVLVHEMVHHLQTKSGQNFTCPGEREKMAYAAQGEWLKLFGTDLSKEFDIDPFTLLATTNCGM